MQQKLEHPLEPFGYSRPPHWLWRLSRRTYIIAGALNDMRLIAMGRLTLHRAWQAGHDHGTSSEYRRIIVNGGDLVGIKNAAFNCGVEQACRRIEDCNDETALMCQLRAARELKLNAVD